MPLQFRVLATVMLSLVLAGCALSFPPSLTVHYRQTVIFDGPEGPFELSGVFKEVASYGFGPVLGSPAFISSYRHGEALGADVPGVGYVVQTLVRRGYSSTGTIASTACGVPPPDLSSIFSASFWLGTVDRTFTGRCELPVSESQLVVIFPDPAKPETGTAYFPAHLPDGLSIRSIVLERTTEPVTYGRLPTWMWQREPGTSQPQLSLLPPDGSVFGLTKTRFIDGE